MTTLLIGCKKKDLPLDGFVANITNTSTIPIVKGTLNNKPAYFILDTGASISILDTKQIKSYGVNAVGEGVLVIGYGGADSPTFELEFVNVHMGTLSLNADFHGKDISNIVSVVKKISGKNIVGIIGNNNISRSRLVLDFNKNLVRQ